jgi:hypothetical protein
MCRSRGAALSQVPPAGVKTEVAAVNASGALLGPPPDVSDTVLRSGTRDAEPVSLKLMLAGTRADEWRWQRRNSPRVTGEP